MSRAYDEQPTRLGKARAHDGNEQAKKKTI
jgi:hypothetical protein